MDTTYICPTSAKACFTFGHAPVGSTLAPGRGVSLPPGSGVSTISFAQPHKKAKNGSCTSVPISDIPVECDEKLVLKVRQFTGMCGSNFTKCFPPGTLKCMHEPSEDYSICDLGMRQFGKLSDDQDGPADAVAVRVVEAEPTAACAAGSSATTPPEEDSSADVE